MDLDGIDYFDGLESKVENIDYPIKVEHDSANKLDGNFKNEFMNDYKNDSNKLSIEMTDNSVGINSASFVANKDNYLLLKAIPSEIPVKCEPKLEPSNIELGQLIYSADKLSELNCVVKKEMDLDVLVPLDELESKVKNESLITVKKISEKCELKVEPSNIDLGISIHSAGAVSKLNCFVKEEMDLDDLVTSDELKSKVEIVEYPIKAEYDSVDIFNEDFKNGVTQDNNQEENLSNQPIDNIVEIKSVNGVASRHKDSSCELKRQATKQFQCFECSYETTDRNNIRKHLPMHFGKNRWQCHLCDKKYSRKQWFDKHIMANHSQNEEMMNCVTFKFYSCDLCEYKTLSNENMKVHKKHHEDSKEDKLYSCNTCSYKTFVKAIFSAHVRSHGRLSLHCKQCNKYFTRSHTLDVHILSKHSDNDEMMSSIINTVYSCDMCHYKTLNNVKFNSHTLKHKPAELSRYHENSKEGKLYSCNTCSYKTFLKTIFRAHVRSHGRLSLHCKQCNKYFARSHILDAHIVAKHSDNNKMMSSVTNRVYSCDMCHYKTLNNFKFSLHARRHKSAELCQESNISFINKHQQDGDILTLHSTRHCQECNIRFINKCQLDGHILTLHSKNEELMNIVTSEIYSCDICEFKTVWFENIKRHQQIH